MKKLVKQDDGHYALEDSGIVSPIVGSVIAPFTGEPLAGGQVRSLALTSILVGGLLGIGVGSKFFKGVKDFGESAWNSFNFSSDRAGTSANSPAPVA